MGAYLVTERAHGDGRLLQVVDGPVDTGHEAEAALRLAIECRPDLRRRGAESFLMIEPEPQYVCPSLLTSAVSIRYKRIVYRVLDVVAMKEIGGFTVVVLDAAGDRGGVYYAKNNLAELVP